MAVAEEVLGTFHGSEAFPIEWEPGERELFWIYDDLHIPNPVSPMFFDIGGWWLTCDHMFRRFGTPFACDWIAKEINGYVYTAAVPCDSELHSEATEYQARYVPRVPRDPDHAGKIGTYLGWVLPEYAGNFLAWWRERLRPEIERNFAYLDGIDYDAATMREMAVYLEDAIDVEDRNWDSIEDLWRIKEEIKGDAEVAKAFEADTAGDILRALEASDAGRVFLAGRILEHQKAFGYKAIWSHEFAFRTWREDPVPILGAIRGYLATDYDYPSNIAAVRTDLEAAEREVMEGVDGEAREKLREALDLSLGMNPLTPDHHFYIDQGTNARLRIVLIAIGAKLTEAGVLGDPEDVMYLRYNELRLLMADQSALDAQEVVSDRRDAREEAAERRPPSWVGTATQVALDFPYNALWGFPEKFHAGEPATTGEVRGLAASPGVVEGTARYVTSLDEFDQVQKGEILVCRMTNPAWVVLFTKITGLVTEAGGATSHPAGG